ncbi:coiled-coil domain-containing protein 50 isoform X4 [Ictalurus punctatus]|uniref:Coiled-coil domain-containing protein 50 isoform X4 n=1 Tax=Ictalurus punctatus TaxID=7998 RepID=A0A979EIH6_ICTPU|nr:coiled-coil domain-containing protein 50 isoform X4 [Ictalurus punctatus]
MTQIGIDKSHLPHVYDLCQCFSALEDGALAHRLQEQEIEQFYSSNMQKNQAVQNDVRLARRLQDEEEERDRLTHQLHQLEEQDCEYARVIQEELRRCDEEAQKREKEDEEMAKRLQEEEELKIRHGRAEAGYHEGSGDSPLSRGLGLWEQMMRDAELARRLQEEEDKQPHKRSTETEVDFRTVQVAQDEELACYMQRQEKKSNRRSRDLLAVERSHDPRCTGRKTHTPLPQHRRRTGPDIHQQETGKPDLGQPAARNLPGSSHTAQRFLRLPSRTFRHPAEQTPRRQNRTPQTQRETGKL